MATQSQNDCPNVNHFLIASDRILIRMAKKTSQAELDRGAERLRKAREARGFASAADAARALKVPLPTYTHYENGTVGYRLHADRFARFFNVSLDYLISGKGTLDENGARHTLRALGRVSANRWRDPNFAQDVSTPPDVMADSRYPADAQYLLEVEGTSLNRVAPDGSWLLCVDAARAGRAPRENEIVIVEQNHNGLVSTTAKRWRPNGKVVFLAADSNDPVWKNLHLVIDPTNTSDLQKHVVKALVLQVINVL
jgi:transcriptional regulator with XRE-family HTH domain